MQKKMQVLLYIVISISTPHKTNSHFSQVSTAGYVWCFIAELSSFIMKLFSLAIKTDYQAICKQQVVCNHTELYQECI